jgi:aspartate aminotransferase-like enzyme
MPVDLQEVHLASTSSGKGLRAYPGVAMVFHRQNTPTPSDGLPRYLDLGFYAQQDGIPFTFSSNLLHALHAAVRGVNWGRRFAEVVETSTWLRTKLLELGFCIVGAATRTSPAVITIQLAAELNSVNVGNLMQESGFLLSYNSDYLKRKNWIQICLMGEVAREKVVSLVNVLNRVCFRRPVAKEIA